MGGMIPDKRQIVFFTSMFDPTQKRFSEADASLSFREIYERLTFYPIEYAVFIDGDRLIEKSEIDNLPESNHVIVRLFPSGRWKKWAKGAVSAVANAGKDAVNDWYDVAGMLVNPVYYAQFLWTKAFSLILAKNLITVPDASSGLNSQSATENPSLRGASNRARQNGRVGILLGKNLITPDIAGLPYLSISTDGKDQYLHMMFCGGYNNISIDTSSFKIGDTLLNSTNFDYTMSYTQSGASLTEYPYRVISKQVSKLIEATDTDGSTKTTPTNTKQIDVFITFPSGLVYFSNGAKAYASVQLLIEYSLAGANTWTTLASATITRNEAETVRLQYTKVLDNDTSSGVDYSSLRQYDVRVKRITADTDDGNIIDKMYFDTLQSATADFSSGTPNKLPVESTAAAKLTLIALKIKATDTTNGSIESFNYIAQCKAPVYSGSGSGVLQWASAAATSNPAAMFLYAVRDAYINKKPASDSQIDWAAFEAWYTFCNTKSLECNAYITSEIALEELLNNIASSGRASWSNVDGKYTVIVDKAQSTSVQIFTPRNSWGLTGNKSFDELPTALRVKFTDADSGYVETERIVYYDDDNPSDEKIDDYQFFGCTNADTAWRQAKYTLACMYLRSEIFSFSADVEHIACTRWDRISISHDVPLIGLGAGRIKSTYLSGGYYTGVKVDELFLFEVGKTYCATFRAQDGSSATVTLTNPATLVSVETNDLYFATPIAIGVFSFIADDLLVFGLSDSEKLELIVTDIDTSDDLSAKITGVPYVSGLYTFDGGTPPTYDPKISVPGDITNAVVTGIPIDAAILSALNSTRIEETDNSSSAVTAVQDTLAALDDSTFDVAFPYVSVTGFLYYFNLTNGGIYYKSNSDSGEGSQIVSSGGYMFCDNYYVKSEDGFIYTLAGVALTDYLSWCPQLTETNNLLHIKLTDNGVYNYDPITDAISRVGTFTLKHLWIQYFGNSKLLIWDDGTIDGSGNDGFVLINIATGAYDSTIISNVGEVVSFQMLDSSTLVYLDADMEIHKLDITSLDDLLYLTPVTQFDSLDGNLYFVSGNDSGLYKLYQSTVAAQLTTQPYLRASTASISITGSCTINENVITGVSDDDISKVEIGDVIVTTHFPTGTAIISINATNNQIIVDDKATSGGTDFTITISTARILINAATTVAEESITNSLFASKLIYGKVAYNGFVSSLVASFGADVGSVFLVVCRESQTNLNSNAKVAIVRIKNSSGNTPEDIISLLSSSSKFTYGTSNGYGTITFSNTDSSLDPQISYLRLQ